MKPERECHPALIQVAATPARVSRTRVKSKRAVLMARLQAQAEINALEEQQAK